MSKVCIIIPVYNRKDIINRCLQSIKNQTFTDWHLLIVDDGSTDGTETICDNIALSDKRIKVIHKKNGGVSSARNAGLDWISTNDDSPWITFIDSDDWICSNYLQRLIEDAEKHNVDISCCDYITLCSESFPKVTPQETQLISMETYWRLYPSSSVVPWGKIYKKELFKDVRYPIGKVCDDTFTTHRVLFKRNAVAWNPEKLYCYFENPHGISCNRTAELLEQWSEGYEEQAVFFHKKGFVELRDIAIRRMLFHKNKAIMLARQKSDRVFAKKLKTDLKRQYKWAKKELKITIYSNENIYESAVPVRSFIAKKLRKLKKKIRKYIKKIF